MEFQHVSVLPREVLQQMHLQEGGIYVDCTLGGAGHASSILSALQGQCHYIGIDPVSYTHLDVYKRQQYGQSCVKKHKVWRLC